VSITKTGYLNQQVRLSTAASVSVLAGPYGTATASEFVSNPNYFSPHEPKQSCCPKCGGGLRHFGEDISEQLDYVPESFRVIRHVRPKFACSKCETVVEAPAPSRPIARGLAASGLLAHVLVSKYADHCPLYRQAEIYARQGVELDRSTLAGWVGASSELLAPLQGNAHVASILSIWRHRSHS
jgi:transposase